MVGKLLDRLRESGVHVDRDRPRALLALHGLGSRPVFRRQERYQIQPLLRRRHVLGAGVDQATSEIDRRPAVPVGDLTEIRPVGPRLLGDPFGYVFPVFF